MNRTTTLLLIFLVSISAFSQNSQKDVNVIYGDHHIYTIETPTSLYNDKESASTIGLTNFFYNPKEPNDGKRSYMYTNGYDKSSKEENLESFIKADIKNFLKKYPDAKYESVDLGFEAPIIDGQAISYTNLSDRYKEEVVYLETEETVIVFSFAAFNKEDYEKYVILFDEEFIGSFAYRGNDPKPFLEWQKKNKNER